jgi:hypothetical protein
MLLIFTGSAMELHGQRMNIPEFLQENFMTLQFNTMSEYRKIQIQF